jgi:hypothetical protein
MSLGTQRRRGDDRLIGFPTPVPPEKVTPSFIGERWNRGSNQSIPTGNQTTVEFGTTNFTTERGGYAKMYDSDSFRWTIPPGLAGIWHIEGVVRWAGNASGHRTVEVIQNSTTIYHYRTPIAAAAELSQPILMKYEFVEGDTFRVAVTHNVGSDLNIIGGSEYTFLVAEFRGMA